MGAIKSGIGPYEGPDHASSEPSLGQGQPTPEDFRLARGPPPTADTYKTIYFMLTDIEIAKSVKMRPINEVAAELGIHEDQVENYGRYIAKITTARIDRNKLYVREQSGKVLTILLKKRELKPLHFFFEKGYGRKEQIEESPQCLPHSRYVPDLPPDQKFPVFRRR